MTRHFVEMIIRRLTEQSIDEIVESAEVQEESQPILDQHHWKTVELIKRKAKYERGVVSFDLVEDGHGRLQQIHPVLFLSGDDL